MKNACKHFALCTLALILCLALAACGSDNSGDSADYGNDSTVPSTIDGFVKESYDSYDYSAFEGYYLPDSGTDFDYLIMTPTVRAGASAATTTSPPAAICSTTRTMTASTPTTSTTASPISSLPTAAA